MLSFFLFCQPFFRPLRRGRASSISWRFQFLSFRPPRLRCRVPPPYQCGASVLPLVRDRRSSVRPSIRPSVVPPPCWIAIRPEADADTPVRAHSTQDRHPHRNLARPRSPRHRSSGRKREPDDCGRTSSSGQLGELELLCAPVCRRDKGQVSASFRRRWIEASKEAR